SGRRSSESLSLNRPSCEAGGGVLPGYRRRSRREPFELIPVVPLSVVDFADEEISLRVSRSAVRVEELTGVVSGMPSNRREDIQRLAVEDTDGFVGAVDDVEESLLFVR